MPPVRPFRLLTGFLGLSFLLLLIDEACTWLLPPDAMRGFVMSVVTGGVVFLLAYRGGTVLRFLMGRPMAAMGTQKRARHIFREVAGSLRRKIRLVVYQHHQPSAISVHDGLGSTVFLSSSLVDELGASALRGVVGHEVGHILERHNTKQAVILGGLAFFKCWLGIGAAGVVIVFLAYLYVLRTWEFAADRRGADLVGGATMLEACHEYISRVGEDTGNPSWTDFFFGHPSMRKRMAALRQLAGGAIP